MRAAGRDPYIGSGDRPAGTSLPCCHGEHYVTLTTSQHCCDDCSLSVVFYVVPVCQVLVGGWRPCTSWVCVLLLITGPAPRPALPHPFLSLLPGLPQQYIAPFPSHASKRNGGMPAECRGRYDTAIYTQLDNICEDCYNLYKEPDVHSYCRSGRCSVVTLLYLYGHDREDCFSSSYFQRCLQALLLEEGRFLNMAQIIGKR